MINKDSIQPFSDILQKGLGRAFDYIDRYNKLELRRDLLNACLHDLRYDSQCESSLAEWLFELINLTGDSEFYREKVFQALPITDEFWDVSQLYDLVFLWAKQGDLKAKEIIYKTFRKQELNESWLGGEQIVALDGIKGLLIVAEIVGAKLLKDDELWEDDNLIIQASESYGSDEVRSALEWEAAKNIKVKKYFDAVTSYKLNRANIKKYRKNKTQAVDFDTILQKIEGKETISIFCGDLVLMH